MSRLITSILLIFSFTCGMPIAAWADQIANGAPVTLSREGRYFRLSNGYATAEIDAQTGDLWSLKYRGLETMGYVSGHHAGYWEQSPSPGTPSVTIDPKSNGGQRAEVSVKGPIRGFTLEIRYTMGRGDHGLYTYAIFSHDSNAGAAQLGESRFGAKLNGGVFDWLSIDANRNRKMPTGYDWDHGTRLNMKEARRLTTGIYAGQVEHKYDYSALQFDIPAFGWSSTRDHVGLYFINPSMEYLSGGATKFELTGHLDDGAGGDPTLLNYWRGTHYGGSICRVDDDEQWEKVVGPMMIYLNSGRTPDDMFKDALAQAAKEAHAWPYNWVRGVDYPLESQRGAVRGRFIVNDPLAPVPMGKFSNLLVGLAYPDSSSGPPVNWQNDAKHYEFWVRGGNDGSFTIPKVRPGIYELHAITDGILGEYAKSDVTVEPGKTINLGRLEWKPVRFGRQLWDIGIPNRAGSEFFKGDDYFHWGMYLQYAKLFPQDVNYTIGRSDFRKDWYFEQVPHVVHDDGAGRSQGRATTWTIHFTLPDSPHGTATLRLAICGVAARSIDVGLDKHPLGTISGLMYNATINRDGIGGYWVEKDLTFDASKMSAGENTMTLTIPAGGLTSGIIYDYIRLELK
ncbi:MAG TPA: polysaccharide lyase family protein [Tepidisphaeraceae bacterium]|nr:polysaccharide lyase family protein [Tepidisphaeraceae bacterium]